MAQLKWEIELDGEPHTIQFEHTYFAGKRTLIVDGKTLLASPAKLKYALGCDLGSTHEFTINSHLCVVVIRSNGVTYSYDLIIDIDQQNNSTTKPPIPEP